MKVWPVVARNECTCLSIHMSTVSDVCSAYAIIFVWVAFLNRESNFIVRCDISGWSFSLSYRWTTHFRIPSCVIFSTHLLQFSSFKSEVIEGHGYLLPFPPLRVAVQYCTEHFNLPGKVATLIEWGGVSVLLILHYVFSNIYSLVVTLTFDLLTLFCKTLQNSP